MASPTIMTISSFMSTSTPTTPTTHHSDPTTPTTDHSEPTTPTTDHSDPPTTPTTPTTPTSRTFQTSPSQTSPSTSTTSTTLTTSTTSTTSTSSTTKSSRKGRKCIFLMESGDDEKIKSKPECFGMLAEDQQHDVVRFISDALHAHDSDMIKVYRDTYSKFGLNEVEVHAIISWIQEQSDIQMQQIQNNRAPSTDPSCDGRRPHRLQGAAHRLQASDLTTTKSQKKQNQSQNQREPRLIKDFAKHFSECIKYVCMCQKKSDREKKLEDSIQRTLADYFEVLDYDEQDMDDFCMPSYDKKKKEDKEGTGWKCRCRCLPEKNKIIKRSCSLAMLKKETKLTFLDIGLIEGSELSETINGVTGNVLSLALSEKITHMLLKIGKKETLRLGLMVKNSGGRHLFLADKYVDGGRYVDKKSKTYSIPTLKFGDGEDSEFLNTKFLGPKRYAKEEECLDLEVIGFFKGLRWYNFDLKDKKTMEKRDRMQFFQKGGKVKVRFFQENSEEILIQVWHKPDEEIYVGVRVHRGRIQTAVLFDSEPLSPSVKKKKNTFTVGLN